MFWGKLAVNLVKFFLIKKEWSDHILPTDILVSFCVFEVFFQEDITTRKTGYICFGKNELAIWLAKFFLIKKEWSDNLLPSDILVSFCIFEVFFQEDITTRKTGYICFGKNQLAIWLAKFFLIKKEWSDNLLPSDILVSFCVFEVFFQ